MEVELSVPAGTDISVILEEYPDLCEDEGWLDEGIQCYWVGNSMEEAECEWVSYDEAVEFCGFCEGAIDTAKTLIEGNGGWAQGMISRRDFSGLAVSDEEKTAFKKTSERYWTAHERGRQAASTPSR